MSTDTSAAMRDSRCSITAPSMARASGGKETRQHPELRFCVTRIGCGSFIGYTDEQIGPMFMAAPSNCDLPEEWIALGEQR